MASQERRLAAIMFSDICGFSKTMGANEELALQFITLHNDVVQSGADQYGGRIIKKMGDGLLVEFSSAVNAVKCALAVQQAIVDFNDSASEEERIFIRIGIHLGDVVVSGTDILGDGVNVASRIEPLAEPGGICISRDILDLVQNKLAIEAVHLGAKELKNISKQIDIYKVLIDAVSGGSGSATIRHKVDKGPSPRRKRIMIGTMIGGIIAALIMLGLGGIAVKQHIFNKKARNAYNHVMRQADDALKKGDPEKAVKTLKAYPKEFSKTHWQPQVEEKIKQIRPELDKAIITRRCFAFFAALEKENWEEAVSYVYPAEIQEVGRRNIEFRLKFFAGFVIKLGQVTKDKIKIRGIKLKEEDRMAMVGVDVLVENRQQGTTEWKETSPARWKMSDGEWYIILEKKDQPGQQKGKPQFKERPQKPGSGGGDRSEFPRRPKGQAGEGRRPR